jgi:hypothetical protein
MPENYVRFDEYEDVLASTELLATVFNLKNKSALWKWTILAAHNGAQGALVCAIKDASGANILDKRSAIAMLGWFEKSDEDQPRQHLDRFVVLLTKYRKKYPVPNLPNQQIKNLCKLNNEFRNNFVHFIPQGWSIDEAIFSPLIESALDLIEAAMKQHQVEIHLNDDMRLRLDTDLAAARSGLAALGNGCPAA